MHIRGDSYDRFREGLAAGQQAGRSHEFMYAIGFAAGFLFAAIIERGNEPEYKSAAHGA